MFVSRLTAYFRRKCVAATDDRVQKMNEVLTYIKFIKMYAWVKAFSQSVQSEFKDPLVYSVEEFGFRGSAHSCALLPEHSRN